MKSHKPNILLIYTGGTIGMVKDFETGALIAFDFNELLSRIPELHLLDCQIETYSFEVPIDSSNMNVFSWSFDLRSQSHKNLKNELSFIDNPENQSFRNHY